MKIKKWKEINHKEKGIILFTILSILLIVGVFFYQSFAVFQVSQKQNLIEGKIGSLGDIEFAYYLDGTIVPTAPEKKENYTFDDKESSCTNGATINWNYQIWAPTVLNLTKTKTKCNLKFKTEYSESILEGAVPELKESLVPIIIEENTGVVKKADIKSEWYSYGEQKWANAVILQDSYEVLKETGKINSEPIKNDEYLSFDGVDDYVNLGLENYDFQNQLTMVLKFKITQTMTHNFALLGSWDDTNNKGGGLYITTNGNLIFDVRNGKNNVYDTNKKINMGEIYTVVATYDGTAIKVYVNGGLIGTSSVNGSGTSTVTSCPIALGVDLDDEENFHHPSAMNAYQAAIYNRVISEEEIQAISNNFEITNGEKLIRYVDFTNKTDFKANEIIPEDMIESYFVWIPRYRYQIWNGEKETNEYKDVVSLGEIANATEKSELNKQIPIRIEFENKNTPTSKNTTKGEYLTHPAFTTFDTNGLWVGKFETGYKGANSKENAQVNEQKVEKVIIKPNVYSWRNINVSNAFNTSFEYQKKLNSHMMKNTEWGAVAYLTNSKYGRCKDNECEEVRINNNESYITGYSAKTKPTCGHTQSKEECNYYGGPTTLEVLEDDNSASYYVSTSKASSTTGNYTGIYDMAGGSWEHVMGVMKAKENIQEPATGQNENNNSGFKGPYSNDTGMNENGLTWPDKTYYDLYEYNTSDSQYQNGNLGDATKEFGPFYSVQYQKKDGAYGPKRYVSSYNADTAFFVNYDSPWFIRGGSRFDGTDAGMFTYASSYGDANGTASFRIVLTP